MILSCTRSLIIASHWQKKHQFSYLHDISET